MKLMFDILAGSLLHQRTPPGLLEAQGQSDRPAAEAHPRPVPPRRRVAVVVGGLEADR